MEMRQQVYDLRFSAICGGVVVCGVQETVWQWTKSLCMGAEGAIKT